MLVSWGPEVRCLRLHVAQKGPQSGRNRKNMFKSWPFTVGTCLPFRSCRGNIGYANSCKSRCASFFSVVCWRLQAVAKLVFRALSEDQTVSETKVLSCFVGVFVLWGSIRPDAWLAWFWVVLGRNKTNVAPLQCLNWMDEIGYSPGKTSSKLGWFWCLVCRENVAIWIPQGCSSLFWAWFVLE